MKKILLLSLSTQKPADDGMMQEPELAEGERLHNKNPDVGRTGMKRNPREEKGKKKVQFQERTLQSGVGDGKRNGKMLKGVERVDAHTHMLEDTREPCAIC